jgi:hypothetical protein
MSLLHRYSRIAPFLFSLPVLLASPLARQAAASQAVRVKAHPDETSLRLLAPNRWEATVGLSSAVSETTTWSATAAMQAPWEVAAPPAGSASPGEGDEEPASPQEVRFTGWEHKRLSWMIVYTGTSPPKTSCEAGVSLTVHLENLSGPYLPQGFGFHFEHGDGTLTPIPGEQYRCLMIQGPPSDISRCVPIDSVRECASTAEGPDAGDAAPDTGGNTATDTRGGPDGASSKPDAGSAGCSSTATPASAADPWWLALLAGCSLLLVRRSVPRRLLACAVFSAFLAVACTDPASHSVCDGLTNPVLEISAPVFSCADACVDASGAGTRGVRRGQGGSGGDKGGQVPPFDT